MTTRLPPVERQARRVPVLFEHAIGFVMDALPCTCSMRAIPMSRQCHLGASAGNAPQPALPACSQRMVSSAHYETRVPR